MNKTNILIVMSAVIMMAALSVKAKELSADFDCMADCSKKRVSLQEEIASAVETSGIIVPGIPAREYSGGTDRSTGGISIVSETSGRQAKIFLKTKQESLKTVLVKHYAAMPNNTEVLHLLKTDKTKIIFDSEHVYITSSEYDILLTINDGGVYKELGLNNIVNTRGKCRWVKKVIKKCGAWGQAICLVWDLIEIVEEVCDALPDTNPTTPNSGGGSGGTYHNGQGGDSDYDVNKHLQ